MKYRILVAGLLIVLSSLLLLSSLEEPMQQDVQIYKGVSEDLMEGQLPYRDRVLEYPPYAVGIFLLPSLISDEDYIIWFAALALTADLLLKWLLIKAGFRHSESARQLLPLFGYSFTIPFLRFFFLQRYDIWPALVTTCAVWLFCAERQVLAGIALAAGVGLKLYPIVCLPPLLVLAVRRNRQWRFAAGLALGFMPLGFLSFFVPWWRFALFHVDRGIQVESLYGSLLWLIKLAGQAKLSWVQAKAWEVHGPLATAVLPWAHAIFGFIVTTSCAAASWSAWHCKSLSLPQLCKLLLVPLLGFVAFNQVLSPQYLIWIVPLAALGALERNAWVTVALTMTLIMTPLFYPSPDYHTGLGLGRTLVVVVRNLILVAIWGFLLVEALGAARRESLLKVGHSTTPCGGAKEIVGHHT